MLSGNESGRPSESLLAKVRVEHEQLANPSSKTSSAVDSSGVGGADTIYASLASLSISFFRHGSVVGC